MLCGLSDSYIHTPYCTYKYITISFSYIRSIKYLTHVLYGLDKLITYISVLRLIIKTKRVFFFFFFKLFFLSFSQQRANDDQKKKKKKIGRGWLSAISLCSVLWQRKNDLNLRQKFWSLVFFFFRSFGSNICWIKLFCGIVSCFLCVCVWVGWIGRAKKRYVGRLLLFCREYIYVESYTHSISTCIVRIVYDSYVIIWYSDS